MTTVSFTVHGRAFPQGSKVAWVPKDRRGRNQPFARPIMRESSGANHKAWRRAVTRAAKQYAPSEPFSGAVSVSLGFSFARPKAHYHHRLEGPVLRADAPIWATSGAIGDTDKLERSILDALTDAGFWNDDRQVAALFAVKRYSDDGDSLTVRVDELIEVAA